MLFCLCLACVQPDDGDATRPDDVMRRYERRSIRACAVIADDSPYDPYRLVFLYKTDENSVDAQAELFAVGATKFRCGEVPLSLTPGRERTPVTMDFMTGVDPVTLRELRVYRLGTTWSPEDPFVLAIEDHRPFSDYTFHVNLLLPPWSDDPSTILLPP